MRRHDIGRFAGLLVLALGVRVASAGDTICFEAESAGTIVPPMKAVSSAAAPADNAALKEASGGGDLEITEGAGKPPAVGGEAVFRFDVPEPGEYCLWCRVWWLDSCGNSFTIVADGGRPFIFGEDGTYKKWHWVKGMKMSMTAGSHELRIQNREDGVRLDQVLLSRNPDYVPVGVEEVTVAPATGK